jgi:hypothetical protein
MFLLLGFNASSEPAENPPSAGRPFPSAPEIPGAPNAALARPPHPPDASQNLLKLMKNPARVKK